MIDIPVSPNSIINGTREGLWTLLLADAPSLTAHSFTEVQSVDEARFFAEIEFHNGTPVGHIEVRYKADSVLHWEGELLKIDPIVLSDGTHTFYHLNGTVEKVVKLIAGKIADDTVMVYWSDGTKREEVFYEHGRISSVVTSWHSNGIKFCEILYQNGISKGVMIVYAPDGNRRVHERRRINDSDEIRVWFHPDGAPRIEVLFRDRQSVSVVARYDESGQKL